MIVKLLTEHYLEFLSLEGGCRGSSESTLVKMSNCWKSHAGANFLLFDSISFCFLCCLQSKFQNIFSRVKQVGSTSCSMFCA